MVWEETDQKTNDHQTRHVVARDLERYVTRRNAKRGKSGLWTNRSSTMPEHCVVFTSLIFDDGDFKDIMKNARRELEVPMPAAMPCKIQREKHRETCRVEKRCKTKYDCVVEADESFAPPNRRKGEKHHYPKERKEVAAPPNLRLRRNATPPKGGDQAAPPN